MPPPETIYHKPTPIYGDLLSMVAHCEGIGKEVLMIFGELLGILRIYLDQKELDLGSESKEECDRK